METSSIVRQLLFEIVPVNPLTVTFSTDLLKIWTETVDKLRQDPEIQKDLSTKQVTQPTQQKVVQAVAAMLRLLLPSELVGKSVPGVSQQLLNKLNDASNTNNPKAKSGSPE